MAAVVGLAAPLAAFAFSGWYSRYAADDYCTAGQVIAAGLINAQSQLYVDWSGRFAATLLITLVELFGPGVVPLLPVVTLVAWVAVTAWTIRAIARATGSRVGVAASIVLSALLVYATLQTTADMPQVVYWQTGLITYLWPLVLATFLIGLFAHTSRPGLPPRGRPLMVGACFLLALLAGGTSETFAAAQVPGLVLAGSLLWLAGGKSVWSLPLAGLAGAILALAIVAVAPGNEVRQDAALRTAVPIALPSAIDFTLGWLRLTFARPHAAELVLLIGLPATIGATSIHRSSSSPRLRWYVLTAGALSVLVVILASMLPAFYALGSNPPGRAQLIPQYLLVCTVAAAGWIVGSVTGPRLARASASRALRYSAVGALLVLLVFGPVFAAGHALQQVGAARAYATAWDRIDADIRDDRRQGLRDVTIPQLPSTGNVQNLQFVGPDRGDWFNECVARYYGVGTIAAET
jgi:hypothetical protein